MNLHPTRSPCAPGRGPFRMWWGGYRAHVAVAVLGILLTRAAPPLLAEPATPVAVCTGARAPQPAPTPTRPAWAGEEPYVPLEPVPDAHLDPLIPEYVNQAITRFAACWNAGDWTTVVSGTTPRFLGTAFDVSSDPAALANLGLGTLTLLGISAPRLWSDQRVATEVLLQRGPQVISERWFFLVMHGDALLDEAVSLPLPPLGDRVVLGVETAGFPANWAWRGTSPGVAPAVPLIVIAVANRTPEPRSITVQDASGAVSGYLTVPAASERELGLRNLPAGTYEITGAERPDADPLQLQISEAGT